MSFTRRGWFKSLVGVVSPVALLKPQGGSVQKCSGNVRRANDGPLVDSIVQLIQPDGLVRETRTDAMGGYVFENATAGPYQLMFRDGVGRSMLHEVRQLTGGTPQSVSVTLDPAAKSVQSAYDALQALEALAAFIRSNPEKFPQGIRDDVARIPVAAAAIQKAFAGTPPERRFIAAKADSVVRLAAVPLVG